MRASEKGRIKRGLLQSIAAVVAAAALTLTGAVPAMAAEDTTISIAEFRNVSSVTGAVPASASAYPDVSAGYPSSIPDGYESARSYTTALIVARTEASVELDLYCIDLHTPTNIGYSYSPGAWDDSTVGHAGYVAQILANYYPYTSAPGSGSTATKVSAVQAAIWFFSDGFVLQTSSGVRAQTAAIVADVLARGPLTEPAAPAVTIQAPADQTVLTDEVAGPFVVSSADGSAVTVSAAGGTMWSDAAGTVPITAGTAVASGSSIHLRANDGQTEVVLTATGAATAVRGTVFLYDGGAHSAQKLILATDAQITTSTQAGARFTPFGSLTIDKTILGDGAGLQGEIVLVATAGDATLGILTIPAGATGAEPLVIDRLPAGTEVTVTETATGANASVVVETEGTGTVTIAQGANEVSVTDTYTRVGSLAIDKTIAGPGAGLQGEVVIEAVDAAGTVLGRLVVDAGSPAGTYSTVVSEIPVGTQVSLIETVDGTTDTVRVVTTGEGTVQIALGVTGVEIVDTYTAYGSLTVDKTITGTGAGLQGDIVIEAAVDGEVIGTLEIPAGATEVEPLVIEGIPVGTQVTVTETVDGATGAVLVETTGEGTVTIVQGPNSVEVVDTYTHVGSIRVDKTIAGTGAGLQGEIVLEAIVDGEVIDTITLPAGVPAGTYTAEIGPLPVGTVVTIAEPSDGADAASTVVVTGLGEVTVSADEIAGIAITDTYTAVVGPDRPGEVDDDSVVAGDSDDELAATGTASSAATALMLAALAAAAGGAMVLLRRRAA